MFLARLEALEGTGNGSHDSKAVSEGENQSQSFVTGRKVRVTLFLILLYSESLSALAEKVKTVR